MSRILADTTYDTRMERGLTLKQVEAKYGINDSTLSLIERGITRWPSAKTKARLAKLLRRPVKWIDSVS